jgi:hypothetical protein
VPHTPTVGKIKNSKKSNFFGNERLPGIVLDTKYSSRKIFLLYPRLKKETRNAP